MRLCEGVAVVEKLFCVTIVGRESVMQNQRRQGIATSCGLARNVKEENVDSDGCACPRDYSRRCENTPSYEGRPQDCE